jgi:hypothetical protein
MLDESLRNGVHSHSPDAGVAVKRVGAAAGLFGYRVLEEPMELMLTVLGGLAEFEREP